MKLHSLGMPQRQPRIYHVAVYHLQHLQQFLNRLCVITLQPQYLNQSPTYLFIIIIIHHLFLQLLHIREHQQPQLQLIRDVDILSIIRLIDQHTVNRVYLLLLSVQTEGLSPQVGHALL